MSDLKTNIDPVRAEIMRLEDAKVFDQRAWVQVLIALSDRPNARADAARRMETAKENAKFHFGGAEPTMLDHMNSIDLMMGKSHFPTIRKLLDIPEVVAVETEG